VTEDHMARQKAREQKNQADFYNNSLWWDKLGTQENYLILPTAVPPKTSSNYTFHRLLKFLLPLTFTALGTTLTHGPLGDTPHSNHSTISQPHADLLVIVSMFLDRILHSQVHGPSGHWHLASLLQIRQAGTFFFGF
jgi:hypothetical protein